MEMRREDDDEERRHLAGSGTVIRHSSSGGGRVVAVPTWPTVDGPLGLTEEEESVAYARSFFLWGFALLPFLWAMNCCYFWPVLRSPASSSPASFTRVRPYVVRSAVGFSIFAVLLMSWALVFAIGGERLFGPGWNDLVMYNLADKLGLTGWV